MTAVYARELVESVERRYHSDARFRDEVGRALALARSVVSEDLRREGATDDIRQTMREDVLAVAVAIQLREEGK